jgi:hypothetical protein
MSNYDEEVVAILTQINTNCNFFNYSSKTDSDLFALCQYICEVIQQYGNLEANENTSFEMHNSELDSQTSDEESANDESDAEQAEKPSAALIVEKLARLMIVFERLMQSPVVYGTLMDLNVKFYRRFAVSLLKLIKDENPLVAYLSSRCIAAMLRPQHLTNQ